MTRSPIPDPAHPLDRPPPLDLAPKAGPGPALTSLQDLAGAGLLAPGDLPDLAPIAAEFRIRLSPAMAQVLTDEAQRGTPDQDIGPMARQFLPQRAEAHIRPEELLDPIGDGRFSPAPGLTHRYPDRVILHVTKTCAVYCRFCFRRETVGEEGSLPEADLEAALAYIAATPTIWEVILTGGDPLVLSPRRLGALLARLAAIPHLGALRIHSRMPVVAPEKITPALLGALDQPLPVVLVTHSNHPDEITPAARAAFLRLARAGVPLRSQTVLLRGVNDRVETLEALFRALVTARVQPYYLHHCDLARGTSHFRVPIAEGRALMAALRQRLSGAALPRYVLDLPGGHGKVPLEAGFAEEIAPRQWQITDRLGRVHRYDDLPADQA